MVYFRLRFYIGIIKGDITMDDGGGSAGSILFIILLVIDFILYAFGSAVQTINSNEVEQNAENKKNRKVKRIFSIIVGPTKFINTLQILVTTIHIVIGGLFFSIWRDYFLQALTTENVKKTFLGLFSLQSMTVFASVFSIFLLTLLVLTVGIMIPKAIGKKFPKTVSNSFINIVWFLMWICTPLSGLIKLISGSFLRIFGIKDLNNIVEVTEEEIISMVNEGQESGVLEASEAEMITNIFEYGDKEAKDIMTHRKHIVAIDGSIHFKEVLSFVLEEKNSRFPVYEENLDHIIGILHLKDLMRIHKEDETNDKPICEIKGLIREVEFVPETQNIDAVFKLMQTEKVQMVMVVDEYGQTSGLLAMEDIIEEIVGNIMDEYDEEEDINDDPSVKEFFVNGMTRLEDLEDRLSIKFCVEDFETLNGYIMSKLDRIPEEDEQYEFTLGEYSFKIISVENKIIQKVLVTKNEIDASFNEDACVEFIEKMEEESEGK